MLADGALAKWLKSAKTGHCACGRRLPAGRTRLCRRRKCRQKYNQLYAQDRFPTTLREVTAIHEVAGRPRVVELELACGHRKQTPVSKANRSRRQRCDDCKS